MPKEGSMAAKDWVHQFMNIALPLIAPLIVLVFLPPYLIFKLLRCVKRSIFSENVAGKVILITGASSGIGEHLAYKYARRGARLALAARREERLRVVAHKAHELGSPDVLVIRADVSKVGDCKRLVDEAVNHFGQLDHLVNNAGIVRSRLFEDYTQVSDVAPIMDINFWGSVYCTQFAVPHLKKNKGKIVVISSVAAWSPIPKLSFYNASKAALARFYETLRVECGSHIGITIVNPGAIESEMTAPDKLSTYDVKFFPPIESTERCAEAIVKSACRGDIYLTEPSWASVVFLFKLLFPEIFEWALRRNFNSYGSSLKQASTLSIRKHL